MSSTTIQIPIERYEELVSIETRIMTLASLAKSNNELSIDTILRVIGYSKEANEIKEKRSDLLESQSNDDN